jgi:hypothetical protein
MSESIQPDELAPLKAENERLTSLVAHLDREVARLQENYKVLYDMHTKIERRATR